MDMTFNNGDVLHLKYTYSMTYNRETTMDPATLIALFTTFATIIQKCRDEQDVEPTDDELISAARGGRGVRTIRKGLRAQGFRGRKFRTAQKQVIAELADMDDAELLEQVIRAPEMEADDEGFNGLDYNIFA